MSNINYMGGLKREYHHIKVPREGQEDYEPAMVLLKHELPGRSFIIPIDAMWKYVEPSDNKEAMTADRKEFTSKFGAAKFRLSLATTPRERDAAAADLSCCLVAEMFARGMGFLLCTSWNLAKIMQMMEITPSAQAAAQLLLWIQDGLEQLKNMPPCPEDDNVGVAGEVTLFEGGTKIASKDMVITETDLAEENQIR